MIRREDLDALREPLGGDGVEQHAPVDVDGVEVAVTLRPSDGPSLARTLATLSSRGLAALVRGGGDRFGFGNPPLRADVILCTERLHGVDVFEPAEGVCHALAGTALSEVRAVVNSEGWEVPLDPPGSRTTVGGALAAAAVGPRAQALGVPRDAALGLRVALASGELARCGGRVVKNVTGYDLGKLYTGSFGTLGVIESAWLRLRPLPARVRSFEARVSGLGDACSAARAAARRASSRATALLAAAEPEGELRIVVELAGEAAGVDRDAESLARELGAEEAPAEAIDRVRERQGALPGEGGLRFRIAALPSRFPELLAALRTAGAETLCYPGLSLVYAGFGLPPDGGESAAERAFGAVATAVAGAEASFVCEASPTWAKAGREMYGEVGALVPLFEGLKARFDPKRVLNPGRFAGGL